MKIYKKGKATIGLTYTIYKPASKKDATCVLKYDKKELRRFMRCARRFRKTVAYMMKHGFTFEIDPIEVI